MSMKQEIETWVAALQQYDSNDFEAAVLTFAPIEETSKILFNIGVIKATLGQHEQAVSYYQRATGLDQYLAVAYFQQGVSNFLLGDFEEALANFNDTLLYLRGNKFIDYEQLGLKFKLYSCEALFNRGLCYIYLQHSISGMQDLRYASKEKIVAEHDVIDEAIREEAEGYTVFSIPVGLVFRPSEAKVKNVQTRHYMGKAQLVAAAVPELQTHKRNVSSETWARDDRPIGQLSYAATQLVKPNVSSRPYEPKRQQSEPPVARNTFPPTPPPEDQKPFLPGRTQTSESQSSASPNKPVSSVPSRSQSSHRRPPPALDLTAAGSNLASFAPAERSPPKEQYRRRAPARAQSERPTQSRRQHSATDSVRDEVAACNPQDDLNFSSFRPCNEQGMFGIFPAVDSDSRQASVSSNAQEDDTPKTQPSRTFARPHAYTRASRDAKHDFISEDREAEAEAEANSGSDQNNVLPLRTHDRLSSQSRTRNSGSDRTTATAGGNGASMRSSGLRDSTDDHHPPRSSSRSSRNPAKSSLRTPTSRTGPGAAYVRVKKIRIKAHCAEDVRYVMAPAVVDFGELVIAVSRKFDLPVKHINLKLRDEVGDIITLGDQEDLDTVVATAKDLARREGVEMAKLEMWVAVAL